jgi:hypothetical protein
MPGRRWLCDLKQEASDVLRMCCRTFRCRASTQCKDLALEGYCGLRRHRFFSSVCALHDKRGRKPIQRDRCQGCEPSDVKLPGTDIEIVDRMAIWARDGVFWGKICTSVPAPESWLAVWGQGSYGSSQRPTVHLVLYHTLTEFLPSLLQFFPGIDASIVGSWGLLTSSCKSCDFSLPCSICLMDQRSVEGKSGGWIAEDMSSKSIENEDVVIGFECSPRPVLPSGDTFLAHLSRLLAPQKLAIPRRSLAQSEGRTSSASSRESDETIMVPDQAVPKE